MLMTRRWLCGLAILLLTATARAQPGPAAPSHDAAPFERHLADYDAELRGPDGRVDIDAMIARLKELGVHDYYWLIWHAPTDWDDLKLFLPKARAAGIRVWVYLVPPTESPPKYGSRYSEPFRLDYPRWAEEIARLSMAQPNLAGWVIDDFYSNRRFFTPGYVQQMRQRARQINPKLVFMPLMYPGEIGPAFVESYRPVIDGVVVAYLHDRADIDRAWAVLNDADVPPAPGLSFPWSTPSHAGDYVMASEPAKVLDAGKHVLHLRERDDFTGATSGYHFKQLLVDGEVVWEEDVAGGSPTWRDLSVDVSRQVRGRQSVRIALRLLDRKGVSNFGVHWQVRSLRADGLQLAGDLDRPGEWTVSRRGAFTNAIGVKPVAGGHRFHIPFVSMVAADAGEFRMRHGDPSTPERIAAQLEISLRAWKEGKCDGVVTYCLDKRTDSRTFPLVQEAFGDAGDRPGDAAGDEAPATDGGGPR